MKKKILYITNKEVPYKTIFFNELSKKCELKVIFQSINSNNRNEKWAKSILKNFQYEYVDNDNFGKKFPLLKTFKLIKKEQYDYIIFGCITDKVQLIIMALLKVFRKKYYLNLDGECFINIKSVKGILKKYLIRGAEKYFVAGEKSAENIKRIVDKKVIPYYFSSLLYQEINNRRIEVTNSNDRENFVLVVGQFFEYKGLDIALKVAKKMPEVKFKFVGMGYKTDEFIKHANNLEVNNIEIIPFLQQDDLNNEYKKCKMLILPSRKECWGLVVNEAASYGTPIISTYGSGAAVEFLNDRYSQFLAKSGDVDDLYNKILLYEVFEDKEEYMKYLLEKSKEYYIEKSVDIHINELMMNK